MSRRVQQIVGEFDPERPLDVLSRDIWLHAAMHGEAVWREPESGVVWRRELLQGLDLHRPPSLVRRLRLPRDRSRMTIPAWISANTHSLQKTRRRYSPSVIGQAKSSR